MRRRDFMTNLLAGGAVLRSGAAASEPATEVVIERAQAGRPHAGKVLAAIQPHVDDIPLMAAGTVAKLIQEGYTGYLIRVTNDDMGDPPGERGTIGENVLRNERDNQEVARILGLRRAFDLNYSNHLMDGESRVEIRARLIFLFRLLKVDTVISYDPSGHYEENPDHYVTAQCVEAACWIAGREWDYPEHLAAGIQPHAVSEKYYHARFPEHINRVVDITPFFDQKVEANRANRAKGPAGSNGSRLRAALAKRRLRLPLLGDDDVTAQCVEAACWIAGREWDYPEHIAAGIQPHAVREKYYHARFPEHINRVVDITPFFDQKVEANRANRAKGPAGSNGSRLRAALAKRRLRLSVLGDDDVTAERNYIREFVLARDRELGRRYGLEYAEQFHYIGPGTSRLEDYIRQNARPLP